MDDIAAGLRRERAIRALLPLFFVSGATALVYQTIWARQLHLLFGTSTFAIATVLSAFMAGLAVGGYIMSRYADTLERPLRAYGLLEIGIGIYAVIFPLLVTYIEPIYLAVWEALHPTPLMFGVVQFLLVGSLLIIPTAFMGATLPLLARFATERLGAAGDRVGTLYSINTAGAVFGTWFSGFILLPGLGLFHTTVAAAVANLLLGSGAILLDRWATNASTVPVRDDLDEDVAKDFTPALVPVAIAIGLAGFASLMYEVAWFRLLALMLGPSVYAFSVMLLAFLIGIAIGGKAGGPLADKMMQRHKQPGVFITLAAIEVGVAVTSYVLMYTYQELPFWYVWLYDLLNASANPGSMWWVSLVLSGIIMTPPALLMGAAFPVAVRAVIGAPDELGKPVGLVYSANTFGAVFGAALAGFVFLPLLQVQGTIFVAGAINLAAAAVLLMWPGIVKVSRAKLMVPIAAVAAGLLIGVAKPPWDPMVMTAGMYKYVSEFEDHTRQGILDYTRDKYEMLYYKEGITTVVTVAQNKSSGNIWLANNGKVDASSTTDMPTQVLCALLPAMYADKYDDVLVIGLASGVTAGALTQLDDLGHMEVVEIEPALERAAELFSEYNHNLLEDDRVELIWNDGRNHVLLADPASYDLIVSEPPNPWITGVSNLFTKEFLEMGKTKLRPGGVWSQWVQMYGMDRDDMKTLLHTFAEVHSHVALFMTIEDSDLVLVGSDKPLTPNIETIERLMANDGIRRALVEVEIEDVYDILALYRMDRDRIMKMAGKAPLNTDDNMRIEYSAPLNLHRDTQEENNTLILENSMLPRKVLGTDPLRWRDLAENYYMHDDVRGVVAIIAAAKYAESGSELKAELLDDAERYKQEFLDIGMEPHGNE